MVATLCTPDGTIVGAALGTKLGDKDGPTLGTMDGLSELNASALVGATLGTLDGTIVGAALGDVKGASDGVDVGAAEGTIDGLSELNAQFVFDCCGASLQGGKWVEDKIAWDDIFPYVHASSSLRVPPGENDGP